MPIGNFTKSSALYPFVVLGGTYGLWATYEKITNRESKISLCDLSKIMIATSLSELLALLFLVERKKPPHACASDVADTDDGIVADTSGDGTTEDPAPTAVSEK